MISTNCKNFCCSIWFFQPSAPYMSFINEMFPTSKKTKEQKTKQNQDKEEEDAKRISDIRKGQIHGHWKDTIQFNLFESLTIRKKRWELRVSK